jgi:hypothetical protein
MLLVLSAIRGETNVILLLPMCLMLALGAVYVAIALRDGRRKKDPSLPVLPTNPLGRQRRECTDDVAIFDLRCTFGRALRSRGGRSRLPTTSLRASTTISWCSAHEI